MTYDLKTQLKKLNAITPDRAFVAHSRQMILKNAGNDALAFVWSPTLLVPAFAVLIIFLGAFLQYFSRPITVSAFDEQSITQEFDSTVGASLQEITANQTINQTISSAITEIGDTKTSHLSPTLLQTEAHYADFTDISTSTEDVDSLLNQVLN